MNIRSARLSKRSLLLQGFEIAALFTNHEEQILLKLKSSREQRSFLAFFACARIHVQFEYITEGSQFLDFTHLGLIRCIMKHLN